jgi:hypothetical protein
MLAVVRPDDWNLPLFVHVAGAAVLVGLMVAVAAMLLLAARSDIGPDTAALSRLGFRTLLWGAIPAYIVMRVGAEWIYSKEEFGGTDPDWVGIGYAISDLGLLLLIVTTVLAWRASRKAAADPDPPPLGRAAAYLSVLLIVAYLVAVWAMTTKPGV